MADLLNEICQLGKNKPQATGKPQCPRVPKSLVPSDANGSDGHHYEPKAMSFGPYHRGNPKLVRGEKIKLNLAVHFFQVVAQQEGKSVTDSVSSLFGLISRNSNQMRDCYDSDWTEKYLDEEFCVMMLVDGCALLCYILCVCIGGDLEDYDIRYQDLSRLHRDALLLENQLPYELLLEKLKRRMPDRSTDDWRSAFQQFFGLIDEPFIQESFGIEEKAYSFLQKMKNFFCGWFLVIIQIFNRKRNPNPDVEAETNPDVEAETNPDVEEETNPDVEAATNLVEELETNPSEESKPYHLLHLYRTILLGDELSSPADWEVEIGGPGSVGVVKEQAKTSFRNVKELMAAGIRIKPSPTRCLRDISFTSNGITACLRLPTITIDNSTKAMFFNLIAFEMSSDVPRDFISYLRVLDSLIDHADDVEELQSAGVLRNNLGTHEDVAQFFNTVSADLDSNCHAYKGVRIKIRKHLVSHYNSQLKMWMTQCLHTYFGSPWTIIAWVGAALALFFTAVQTYFSAFSH